MLVEREKREPDVFMYSRELQQERRIASSALVGPLLGTDFTYEDFAFLQHVMANGKIQRGADVDVDGHPAYVIETTPDEETSAYSRIRTVVDKAWCVPIKTEFFGPNGSVAKELNVERADVEQIGERWVPRQMTMVNHKSESRTVLKLTDIKFEPELADSLFIPASLCIQRTGMFFLSQAREAHHRLPSLLPTLYPTNFPILTLMNRRIKQCPPLQRWHRPYLIQMKHVRN